MALAQRKLAAIVGVDVVGYSALTERDESAAIQAVTALQAAVAQCAAAHSGRVFHRAGDGVMVEFPSAMDAVRFSLQLLRRLRKGPPVRIGAHLGEVRVQPDGDLLGHGVNVTARLMAMSEPRSVLLSETIRAPLPERVRRLFLPQGPVQLDKMSETIAVYGVAGRIGLWGRLKLSRRRPWRIAMIAGGAAATAGLAWMATPRPAETPLVAVLAFDTVNGGEDAKGVAMGLTDDVIMTLSEAPGLRVAARTSSFAFVGRDKRDAARRLNARYVLDGVVRLQGGVMEVSAQLSERGRAVVWADEFVAPLGDASDLQQEIADGVARFVANGWGRAETVSTLAAPIEGVPAEAVSLYYAGREARLRRTREDLEFAVTALTRATGQAPSFARAWAELAGAQLILADRLAFGAAKNTDRSEALRADASVSADQALALDPDNAYALAVRANLEPADAWSARLAWLDRAAAAAPSDAAVLRARARALSATGMLRAARADLEAAREVDPLDPQLLLIWTLEALGERRQARTLLAQAAGAPNPAVWNTQVLFALFDRDLPQALALLAAAPADAELSTVERLRLTAQGMGDLGARRAALRAWREAAGREGVLLDDAVLMTGLLGDVDGAFGLAETLAAEAGTDAVFAADFAAAPAFSALRRDARYMRLMAHSGLVHYWRAHGRWPDFCAEPALTYRCEDAAETALRSR